MKRFKFSLQTLHEMREQERETAEIALGQATIAVTEAATKIETIQQAITQNVAATSTTLAAKEPPLPKVQLHTEYLTTLEQLLIEARTRHANLQREREVKLQEFVQASAAAEATAKLREQHYARYIFELAREEQNLMDELATIASARRLREAS